jgi:hypothetical protein
VVSHYFKLPYDLSAATILTIAFFHIACERLGEDGGNIGSVSNQSCVGEQGKSLFEFFVSNC